MSRVEREPPHAVLAILSNRVVFALVRQGEAPEGALVSAEWSVEGGQFHERLESALSSIKGQMDTTKLSEARSLRVAIAESCLPVASQPWPGSVSGMGAVRRAWLNGLQAGGWAVGPDATLVAQDAPFGQPRLTVAFAPELLNAIAAFAASCRLQLTAVRPLGAALGPLGAPLSEAATQVLVVVDDGNVILYLVDRGIQDVLIRPRLLAADGAALALDINAHLNRQRVRRADWAKAKAQRWVNASAGTLNLGDDWAPGGRQLMGQLCEASAWRYDCLDALPSPPPAWVWVRSALQVLLIGSVVLGVRGGVALQQGNVTAPPVAASQIAAMPAPSSSVSESVLRRTSAVGSAVATLNLPVSNVLQALQPPRDVPVSLLSLDLSMAGQAAVLRVMGESAEAADVFRYVEHLATTRPLNDAKVTQHERIQGADLPTYRFTVEASWQP